jgi:hypothetical protein
LYKPHSFRLSGDHKLHWKSWRGRTAIRHGVAAFNPCDPGCAAGPASPARVRLKAGAHVVLHRRADAHLEPRRVVPRCLN